MTNNERGIYKGQEVIVTSRYIAFDGRERVTITLPVAKNKNRIVLASTVKPV